MVIEHVAKLAAMLGVMLTRPAEYTGHVHAGGREAEPMPADRVTA